ncbi:MAG: STAS domain-containing protein [Thermoanaerobaculum sp.]|nr:STAS domain-containing protein [Thermoanaerobaculum sp.]MDW7966926.1 STAS domain-containing protein [Thermoanaerobaculum sp.]
MKGSFRDVQGVRILDLSGKITIGAGDVELRRLVEEALAAGKNHVLVNLKDVTHIDSSGIGELVACFTSVKRRGGAMKLLNLPPKINDILQVTQLITVFDVFDDEAEAIASFAG